MNKWFSQEPSYDHRVANLPVAYCGFSPDAFNAVSTSVVSGRFDMLMFFYETSTGMLIPYTHSATTEDEFNAMKSEIPDLEPVGVGPHVACCTGGQLTEVTNAYEADEAFATLSPRERVTVAINRKNIKSGIFSRLRA
jgi:hypothetical protein